MKAPRITSAKLGNNYRVSLGNSFYFEFTDKKKADKFCRDTENFLSHFFVKLNWKLSEVYTRYRSCFFLFFHVNTTNYLLTEKELQQKIANCELVLDRFMLRCMGENANYWAFIDAGTVCDELTRAAVILLEGATRRSETQQKYELQILIDELQLYHRELNNYGRHEATGSYEINFSKHLVNKVG